MYVCPFAMLGLTFARTSNQGSHRISVVAIYIVTQQMKDWNNNVSGDCCCYVIANKHISAAMNI
jgi:hypothetical protein